MGDPQHTRSAPACATVGHLMRCSRLLLAVMFAGCGSGGASTPDAPEVLPDAPPGPIHVDDGAPTRRTCTGSFGNAIAPTGAFGRLDGILVAIVPPGNGGCNADRDHVHLQILANGAIYDAAVNVGDTGGVEDVHTGTREIPMPGPAWAEGWHTGIGTTYVSLGVHAADLPLMTTAQITSAIQSDLATTNHISVFGTSYGPEGIHLVHHQTSQRDGMVIREPLSRPSVARLFSFDGQTF